MDSNEEFVVVNEENDNRRDAVARLDVLVDLFKQTIRKPHNLSSYFCQALSINRVSC